MVENVTATSGVSSAVPSDEPSEARIVDEGIMIALSAVRMAVKNHIIVGALREHRDFDRLEYAETARAELDTLARQNEEYAERVGELRKDIIRKRWKTELTLDQKGDLVQLALRRRVHERLAIALDTVSRDPDALQDVVRDSQQDASREIGSALSTKLMQVIDRRDPNYERGRAFRLQTLISVDLADLLNYNNDY
ncbi:MAG: hypothetical protein R6W83_09495 [Cryobacterium sp.]